MAFTGADVQARLRDAFGLEASMRQGHVAVVITVPEVDRDRDVFESKSPLAGKEGEVLCCCPCCRGGSSSIGIDVGRQHFGAAHHVGVRPWKLTHRRSNRSFRPATEEPGGQRKQGIDEVPRPARHSRDKPIEEHHFGFGTPHCQRAYSADDTGAPHSVGKESSTGKSVGTAAGDADHGEGCETKMIGETRDIRRPILQSTRLLKRAVAVARPIHRDGTNAGSRNGHLVEGHL